MRTLLRLLAVAVMIVAVELAGRDVVLIAAVGVGWIALALLLWWIEVRRSPRSVHPTMQVPALAPPNRLGWELDDSEGRTVRSPMSPDAALAIHQTYAPDFDRQRVLERHLRQHGDDAPTGASESAAPNSSFDPQRYSEARAFADAFDAQLAHAARRTKAYEAVRPPQRMARGSERELAKPQSPPVHHSLESEPAGWVVKSPSVTGMRRIK